MNIGFFPMSGIRCCDPELLRLGLTLPGFVERSKTIASLPSLGLLTLAGMTPSHHHIHYVEVPDGEQFDPLPSGLDLAAISSYSAQIGEAYKLAQRFKAMGVPSVIGGTHVTALPQEASEHCSAVVIGEGEPMWLDVLEDARRGCLQPYYRADDNGYDLADAPMPAFELLDISKYNRLTVQTSRGCPHHCEFCASSVVLTHKYKQKPVAKVLDEIDKIRSLWDRPFIEFADDNSFVNHAYWKELLTPLQRKGLKWFAETDLSVASDQGLLNLMRESGCAQVLIGLESPTDTALDGIELHSNWKFKKFSYFQEAIQTIQSHGITVNGCFVIGLDGHTADIFDQVFSFVKESGLYEVQVTLMTPFPGTPLYARLEREDRLIEPRNWKKCTLFDINFKPSSMSVDELHEGFKKLAVDLYSEEFTSWRRTNYKKIMRDHRHPKGDSM
ncbi:MAG: B12-binding domain-containing radical SAM protein [Pirellulales bacterium]|nr:B12-binding domain-containing radical SAM protein [Pirellulales bacterium]